jgi:xanthine dehydrogenase YagS FAD-binding subunit
MKTFANVSPRDLGEAIAAAQHAQSGGRKTAFAGGGSDLLALVKDRIMTPDTVVSLKAIKGLDGVAPSGAGVTIGGLTTLDALSRDAVIRRRYQVLAEAAESVATPQIRNVATLAGNICQRPWCWYFRNGFPCFKNGGNTCFSAGGENQFHAIFGGGPSYIVHPSDTAVALVALDAQFSIAGPGGERTVPAADFFVRPQSNPRQENVLTDGEILARIHLPKAADSMRSRYHKVLDREAWTHAVVSAAISLDMDGGVCRAARIVLGGVAPVPWRALDAERLLLGQHVTEDLARQAAEAAVAGAKPLAKNGYKVPLTRAIVRRTILAVGDHA